jgi:hypothetical protein
MPDEKAPTDWAADGKRYVPDAEDGVNDLAGARRVEFTVISD